MSLARSAAGSCSISSITGPQTPLLEIYRPYLPRRQEKMPLRGIQGPFRGAIVPKLPTDASSMDR